MFNRTQKFKDYTLFLGIVLNLAVLIYYKYTNFLIATYMDIRSLFSLPTHTISYDITMPIGVSFFTFHAISYLIDVYKNKVPACKNLIDFSMYFTMFPHLVAGPIVRYSEVAASLTQRSINADMFYDGVVRFCMGLGKKILLADQLATISGKIFTLDGLHELNTPLAWLGILCYTFQIYYDFSGYTDMGIGLAQMFGFRFPENFMQPYRSGNIATFWRTWHMTLGRWFKDYLYIPLGGNRGSLARTCLNLMLVFFLCGLWHGASYPFIIWGTYYGILLCIERILKVKFNFVLENRFGVVLTFFCVMIGWVFFSQPTMSQAARYIQMLFSFDFTPHYYSLSFFLTNDKIAILCAAIFFAVYNFDFFYDKASETMPVLVLKSGFSVVVLLLSCANMALYGFKPFIYFQF